MLLVWMRRYGPARATAAAAVGAVLVGWVLAQRPDVLPGLSIHQAAAGRSTLIALVIATAIGAVLLIPSLVILYGLLLGGRFDAAGRDERAAAEPAPAPAPARLLPVAAVLFARRRGADALLRRAGDADVRPAVPVRLRRARLPRARGAGREPTAPGLFDVSRRSALVHRARGGNPKQCRSLPLRSPDADVPDPVRDT